jgi:hypothetical protein
MGYGRSNLDKVEETREEYYGYDKFDNKSSI